MEMHDELSEFFEDLASICEFELDEFEDEIMTHAHTELGISLEDESEFWDTFSDWIQKNIHRFHLSNAMNH